jgi:hypothetical protein
MNRLEHFRYWLILTLLCFWLGSSLVGNKNFDATFYSDSEGYYLYLPAVFLYGSFENLPVRTTAEYQFYEGTNKIATRFTCGVAVLMSPFWAIAHVYKTKIRGKTAIEPYAVEYGVAALIGSCFYLSLGLFFLFKTLNRYFKHPKTSLFTVLVILFGTNLLYYAVKRPAMSHVYSFFIISLLLWLIPKFWEDPSLYKLKNRLFKLNLAIGLLLGLLVLIRPTHLVLMPLFLFFDSTTISALKTRFLWLIKNPFKWFLIPLIMTICWVPQFVYWHYLTGKYLFYSYGNQSFTYLSAPRIFSVFFDICNGFLVYSPAMLFALIGLIQLSKNNALNARLITFIFCTITYICASWWCWWFGQSYGYRAFIDFYPLLAIGLAFYIDNCLKSPSKASKYAHLALFIVCIFVNIRMTTTPFQWNIEPDSSNANDFFRLIKWVLFIGNPF